ncbi:MAG: PolyA polymerase [Parcubacteria group bacterium GW2011_GWF2_43_11]|nr:MAG: PolyA polymerase [Parcubacteria group bacterium GW2011_GWF2_43_11]
MEIPKEVKTIINKLKKHGFEAFVVGGCVRDLLRGDAPKDWDVATSAKPEEIQKVFPKSFYENKFLTVTVQTGSKDSSTKEVEITTYRSESKYTDKRHPDEVKFAKNIQEDLARRDFTINAIAIGLLKSDVNKVIDPFGGQQDLKDKIIKAVGVAQDRFSEDALRTMRAVRFATTLDFTIEGKTAIAIKKNASLLKAISKERIRDELVKIIMADKAAQGIEMLRELGLLKHIMPELEEGYQVTQNKHHVYDCYEHALFSLKYAAQKGFNLYVRMAALLHDIGKPKSKRGEGPNATFYNHEVIGARMAAQLLTRLRFSQKDAEKITKLVRFHLFYYNVDEVTESSVRRLVRQVGQENTEELLQVRMCDRIGSGVPKAEPYKLRHLKYVIDKVSQDPISVKMLKVTGNDVMKELDIQPGPKVGQILDILLSYVLEDPKNNQKEFLEKEIVKLGSMAEKALMALAAKAKKERERVVVKQDEMTKQS